MEVFGEGKKRILLASFAAVAIGTRYRPSFCRREKSNKVKPSAEQQEQHHDIDIGDNKTTAAAAAAAATAKDNELANGK